MLECVQLRKQVTTNFFKIKLMIGQHYITIKAFWDKNNIYKLSKKKEAKPNPFRQKNQLN